MARGLVLSSKGDARVSLHRNITAVGQKCIWAMNRAIIAIMGHYDAAIPILLYCIQIYP